MNDALQQKFDLLQNAKITDLSLTYNDHTRGFNSRISVKAEGLNARTFEIYSHAGTHIDAPYHYGVSRQTVDDFPVARLMGRAWVVPIKGLRPRSILRVDHLGAVAQKFQKGDSLLLRTGWSDFLGQPKYRDQLPRISKDLAQWMVRKSVKMLGVEPPSVADVNNLEEASLIHKILLGGDVVIIEGLTNLHLLESELVWLIAAPLKIEKSDGSPARVMAIEF